MRSIIVLALASLVVAGCGHPQREVTTPLEIARDNVQHCLFMNPNNPERCTSQMAAFKVESEMQARHNETVVSNSYADANFRLWQAEQMRVSAGLLTPPPMQQPVFQPVQPMTLPEVCHRNQWPYSC